MIKNAEMRLAERWFPKGAMLLRSPDDLGVAYVAPWKAAQWQVVGYAGTAGKPSFNYLYKDAAAAEKKVDEFFTALLAHKVRMAEYRDSRKPHTLKVGDIITNSWGYDQTNVDWYRVTRTTAWFVWLKPICAEVHETSFMSGPSSPAIDTSDPDPKKWGFKDTDQPEEQHKATTNQYGSSVCFDHGSGSKWDGRPMRCSWYA